MKPIAVIDNMILAYFADMQRMDVLEKSRFLFHFLLIPERVKNEFASFVPNNRPIEREQLLESMSIDSGFFRLCTTYDPIVKGFAQDIIKKYSKGKKKHETNEGEAEAIAQAEKRNVFMIFTEDEPCRLAIDSEFRHLKCYNSLFLIGLLELNGLLTDYKDLIKAFYKRKPFKSSELRFAILKATEFLGLNPKEKSIKEKYGLKKLLN